MKTHQQKLNELTTEIRKAIPRLMELSDGCVIKPYTQNEFMLDATYRIKDTDYGIYVDSLLYRYDTYSDSEFEIIGHEPLLNDVLEYFLEYTSLDFNTRQMAYILASWDLSKSRLSEQSPELINFLHDLIK